MFAMLTYSGLAALCFSLVQASQVPLNNVADIKVPVQLGVMSRCPDALHCEDVFDRVLERSSQKVEFSLQYIARYAGLSHPMIADLAGPS